MDGIERSHKRTLPRSGWWIVAAMVTIELGLIVANPSASKHAMRSVYVWLWTVAPKPDGVEIPNRFQ